MVGEVHTLARIGLTIDPAQRGTGEKLCQPGQERGGYGTTARLHLQRRFGRCGFGIRQSFVHGCTPSGGERDGVLIVALSSKLGEWVPRPSGFGFAPSPRFPARKIALTDTITEEPPQGDITTRQHFPTMTGNSSLASYKAGNEPSIRSHRQPAVFALRPSPLRLKT